jgi:hypothetical protein
MKVSLFSLLCLILAPLAHAQEAWEGCIDQADFSFNADTFLKSVRVSKSGCVMNFVELSGKGLKFQVNLCDANINIGQHEALDSSNIIRHYAGSSGCPAPLFGADFHVTKKGGVEFGLAKSKVLEIFAAVKKVYGPNIKAEDSAKITTTQATPNSELKLACAQALLDEYLTNCVSFEAKKEPPPPAKEPEKIPGVHPQTIKKN